MLFSFFVSVFHFCFSKHTQISLSWSTTLLDSLLTLQTPSRIELHHTSHPPCSATPWLCQTPAIGRENLECCFVGLQILEPSCHSSMSKGLLSLSCTIVLHCTCSEDTCQRNALWLQPSSDFYNYREEDNLFCCLETFCFRLQGKVVVCQEKVGVCKNDLGRGGHSNGNPN